MTGVYGWLENNLKHKTWEMIDDMGTYNDLPWFVGGDFNEIMYEAEKKGGAPCDFNNLCAFRYCLDRNGLLDLGYGGHPYTWSNKRKDGFIEERLDRFVATESWKRIFPQASFENMIWDCSDHCPMIAHFHGYIEDAQVDRRQDERRLFRFEARWIYHETFDRCLGSFWEEAKSKHGHQWQYIMGECSNQLKKWNKEVYMAQYSRMG